MNIFTRAGWFLVLSTLGCLMLLAMYLQSLWF
jgi:hypothetical protein